MSTATVSFNIDLDGKPDRITEEEVSARLMRFRMRLQAAIRRGCSGIEPDIYDVLIDTMRQPNGARGCVSVTGPTNIPFASEWEKRICRIGKNAGLHITHRRD